MCAPAPFCTVLPAPYVNKPEYVLAQQYANDLADLLAPQSGAYYDVWLDGEKFVSVYKEVGNWFWGGGGAVVSEHVLCCSCSIMRRCQVLQLQQSGDCGAGVAAVRGSGSCSQMGMAGVGGHLEGAMWCCSCGQMGRAAVVQMQQCAACGAGVGAA